MLPEPFGTGGSIVTLDIGVLLWFAGLDIHQADVALFCLLHIRYARSYRRCVPSHIRSGSFSPQCADCVQYLINVGWSGYTESNRDPQLGRLLHYRCAIPAHCHTVSYFAGKWWRGQDSNLCTLRGQIYSLLPLTTRPPLREHLHSQRLTPLSLTVRRGFEPHF